MSSEFLTAGLWIKRGTDLDFEAGLSAVASLTPEQADEYFAITCDDPDDGPATDDGDGDQGVIEPAREALRKHIKLLEAEVASPHGDLAVWATPDGAWEIWFTGGSSFGDDPTEVFEAIDKLWAAPHVLEAIGFDISAIARDEDNSPVDQAGTSLDEAAVRAWLEGPADSLALSRFSPPDADYTMAEQLGIDDDFNFHTDNWLSNIEPLIAGAVEAKLLPEGTLLWMTVDNSGDRDGALITRPLTGSMQLCSTSLDFRDLLTDEATTGIDNAVSVLAAVHLLASELTVSAEDHAAADAEAIAADEEADDEIVSCRECRVTLRDGDLLPAASERCAVSEDGEHMPDMEIHEPPADDPTRDIRLNLVVTVPNDGYDYSTDVGGRIERIMRRLLDDHLVTSVSTSGRTGSGYVEDVAQDDRS